MIKPFCIVGLMLIAPMPSMGEQGFIPATLVQGADSHILTFPPSGPARRIVLPRLPFLLRFSKFSPDGKAIYGQSVAPAALGAFGFAFNPGIYDPLAAGIIKIEWDPPRLSIVPGTAGLIAQEMGISSRSGHVFVQGISETRECGIWEVDPVAGMLRKIAVDAGCLHSEYRVSKDGLHVFRQLGNQVEAADIETGRTQGIDGVHKVDSAEWTVDSQHILIRSSGRTLWIDASKARSRRKLNGKAVGTPPRMGGF